MFREISGIPVRFTPGVPEHVKRMSVQYFLRKTRAVEELALIEEEMKNCIEYWERQKSDLNSAYLSEEGGVRFLIRQKIEQVNLHLKELKCLFSFEQDSWEDFEFVNYETDECYSEVDESCGDEDNSFCLVYKLIRINR